MDKEKSIKQNYLVCTSVGGCLMLVYVEKANVVKQIDDKDIKAWEDKGFKQMAAKVKEKKTGTPKENDLFSVE